MKVNDKSKKLIKRKVGEEKKKKIVKHCKWYDTK